LRGSDIPYNPVFFSYVILTLEELHLFVDSSKLTEAVHYHFGEEDLKPVIYPYDKLLSVLVDLVSSCKLKVYKGKTGNQNKQQEDFQRSSHTESTLWNVWMMHLSFTEAYVIRKRKLT
jgi:hypothetical protein